MASDAILGMDAIRNTGTALALKANEHGTHGFLMNATGEYPLIFPTVGAVVSAPEDIRGLLSQNFYEKTGRVGQMVTASTENHRGTPYRTDPLSGTPHKETNSRRGGGHHVKGWCDTTHLPLHGHRRYYWFQRRMEVPVSVWII